MRILLAYDGSESAKRALDRAAALADKNGRSVTVVSVAETMNLGRGGGQVVLDNEDVERQHELEEASALLRQRGVNVRPVERRGDPATLIVDEARNEHTDLIVLGTRGLNSARRWVMGSVSTDVVHHAPCDVLVVR